MPKRKAPAEKGPTTAGTSAGSDCDAPNKKLAAAEADAKAPSDTEGNTTSISQDEPPPYGSQEYWENRYAESVSAGHSWYFTYDELRPLLLPLLLCRDGADASADDEDDDGEEWEEVGDDDDEEEAVKGEINDDEENDEDEGTMDRSPQAGGGNGSNSDDDGDDDDGIILHAQQEHLPKSVLEVGCGDVPLGHPLLLDLLSMQKDTGNANLVVKEIVCNDYAKSVIDVLREHQKEHWKTGGVKGSYESADGRDGRKIERLAFSKATCTEGGKDLTDKPTLDVTYVVEDARDMAYKDETFDLIIDKGTTDALLSDKEEGIGNCIKVVSEMGRCATMGGFIMVISHMNAHCDAGIDWCDRVLVAGLRASQANASWEIEVHGSDGSDAMPNEDEEKDDEKDDDEEGNNNDDDSPSGSPGPAVYIIHKRPPKQETEKTEDADSGSKDENEEAVIDTIPLKFFTY